MKNFSLKLNLSALILTGALITSAMAQSGGTQLFIEPTQNGFQITWSGGGILQERTNLVVGNWQNIPGAVSPYSGSFTNTEHYYRVLVASAPGDQQWRKWDFGCDDGKLNNFTLQRDGSPVAGSRNCNNCGAAPAGTPGSCWANPENLSAPNGNLYFGQPQDDQVYGRTFLFVNQPTSFSVYVSGDAFSMWLNGQQLNTANNTAYFSLNAGWNEVEFTSYNQNQSTSVTIDIPVSQVVSMDSTGPGN